MSTQSKMNITIPTHAIMAGMLIAPKKDCRAYLNGARLDKANGQLLATNGHVLYTHGSLDLSSMDESLTLPHFSLKGHGVAKSYLRSSTTIITQESDTELSTSN